MLLSSNGAGLGHLTRLMAIARRLPSTTSVVIATESLAAPLVHKAGYLTEYITSRKYSDLLRDRWNRYYHRRLLHLISCHQPDLVAYDGVVPYSGLIRAIEDNPDVTSLWIRRAMWKAGKGQEWIERGAHFDHILEPGDFSEAVDQGVTVQDRAAAHRVGPITLLDRNDLLPRAQAREALGLAGDDPAALLQLGAGNINDVQTTAGRIAVHLLGRGVRVVVAQSPISRTALDLPAGAIVVNLYPLSPYLRAFDFAVSAAGYNSFHELISFGVPSVFMPNENTAYDDQVARVRYAAEHGVAVWLQDPTSNESLEPILDHVVREALSERCLELSPPNGAQAAADWVTELISRPGSGA
jgi:UDP:flavonoid glycosyltransferase YjiC (YdhE family)